jgi:hypothetical protein
MTENKLRTTDEVHDITRPIKLYLLECGGVDNWEGYDDALSAYAEMNDMDSSDFDDEDKLYALEAGGVDNWDWYGESLNHYFDWVMHVQMTKDYMSYEEYAEHIDAMYTHHQTLINNTNQMLNDLGYKGTIVPPSLMGYEDIDYIFDSAWFYIEKLDPPIEQYFTKEESSDDGKQYIKMALSSYFFAPPSDENSVMLIEALRYKIIENRLANEPIKYPSLYAFVSLVVKCNGLDYTKARSVYNTLLKNPKIFSGLGDIVGNNFVSKAKDKATKYVKDNDLPFTYNNFMPKAQEYYLDMLIEESELLTKAIQEIIDANK